MAYREVRFQIRSYCCEKNTVQLGISTRFLQGTVATRLHFCGGHRLERLLDKLALQILGFWGLDCFPQAWGNGVKYGCLKMPPKTWIIVQTSVNISLFKTQSHWHHVKLSWLSMPSEIMDNHLNLNSGNLTLLLKMTIFSGFSHWKWWFSIVMLAYQRVNSCKLISNPLMFSQAQPSLPASRLRRREAAGAVEAALGQGSHGGHEGDPWGETMAKPWEIYGILWWSYMILCWFYGVCFFFWLRRKSWWFLLIWATPIIGFDRQTLRFNRPEGWYNN